MKTLFLVLLSVALCLSGCGANSEPASSLSPISSSVYETAQSTSSDTVPVPKNGDSAQCPAADYLERRLEAYDKLLYVYKDFADGANHFTQKAWMGSSYDDIPEMREDAEGYSGTSAICGELDLRRHTWGGYLFINGVLPVGQTDPAPSFGEQEAGLDLSGASRLVFYAKGEDGGERVEFFMGGLGRDGSDLAAYADSTDTVSLGYVTLSTEWARFEIPLEGLDLSRIACGWGWVTNDTNNPGRKAVRFSVDDIRYEFDEGRIEPMFLQSYASELPGTDDAVINNFSYLYDQCAAVLALSYAGKAERAGQIADAIVYAQRHDRYFTDGRLRNAYMSGNPKSFPGWVSVQGEEFARMPGFYDRLTKAWYEDFYAVSTSTGNMAWAILALCEVSKSAGNGPYLEAARKIGDFVLTLRDDKGGFTGGYEGWEGAQARVTYKSTEHNIDLISAFGQLYNLTEEARYDDAATHAKAFVLSMYDDEKGCFYTGTTSDGVTINRDVIPLDCNTWALLALGDAFEHTGKVLQFIEEHTGVDGGYDFDTDSRDGVWFEGTAQVALAYLHSGNEAKYSEILSFLYENSLTDGSMTAADRDGVTTGFMVSGTELPWTYGKRVHIGATAWLAFAQMGTNPLRIDTGWE